MLALERQRRIIEVLNLKGAVRTVEIATALGVTEETIRRDFEKLESDGQLIRTHGGAYRQEAAQRDLPHARREAVNVAEKRTIALRAIEEIQPGETILLDASSTALELARMLQDNPLTVITNALQVVSELVTRPSIQVILMGGTVSERSLSCLGPLSEQVLECYNVQKAFVSCRGVDPVRGLSESNEQQARLKHRMVELAEVTYLLADHTKLPLKSVYFFGQLSDIDAIITDREPETSVSEALRAAGIKVLTPAPLHS